VYDHPVIQLDILPTVVAAAGIEIHENWAIDGVDLVPYLNGKNSAPPHDALYWRLGNQMAIRQGDWKLVRYDPTVDGATGSATDTKLYNLRVDIQETRDLTKVEPEKVEALQAAWDEWEKRNITPLWYGRGGA
jgi:arylsulfatase A-like enzyme